MSSFWKTYRKAQEISETSEYNFSSGNGPWGIVCNGVSYNYVCDAVKDLDIEDKITILRIGFSHPLPEKLIKTFAAGCEKILVVEEGEPYLEEAIKSFAQEDRITIPIHGKAEGLFSRLYEFDPSLVRRVIAQFFGVPFTATVIPDLSDVPEIPQRPPNLCAGCSHRATFYAVKKAVEGQDTIYPTDIGCYTLGFLPPLSMGDFLICMGSSVSSSCGFSKSNRQKGHILYRGFHILSLGHHRTRECRVQQP